MKQFDTMEQVTAYIKDNTRARLQARKQEKQIKTQLTDTVNRLVAQALVLDGSKMVSTALAILKDNGITPENIGE
jgi:hypothetical protein